MSQEKVRALSTIRFVDAAKRGFMNLFNFSGKAGKAEFWWCFIAWLISFPVLYIV